MEAPRLQAYISRHTQAFRKADFFYTLPQSPFGCVHFSSNPFPSILQPEADTLPQRYRRKGLRKRFRLTISAPLPADFVKICREMNLSLPGDVVEGGAFVDGQRLLGDDIPSVEGRWLGGHSPCN
jgi:hypothetical protein